MRLIDADALNKEIKMDIEDVGLQERMVFYRINEAPTIDAVEVVRGEWKPFDLTWGRSFWYCTACKDSVEVPCNIWTQKPIYNFCPNCGARMKGADDGNK